MPINLPSDIISSHSGLPPGAPATSSQTLQAHSCLWAFALVLSAAWNVLPPGT